MKRFLCFMILCLPLTMHAQDEKGIKWTTGLSWEQIKQKAKTENKYIFLDAMATWCAPCKEMDKNVFTNDSVGEYFNKHFISVKVQMDKTKNDNEQVRSWYDAAEVLKKQYDIYAFPSLLFLNHQGRATDLQRGYRSVNDFLIIGAGAMAPGKVYLNTLDRYNELKLEYRKGNIDYKELPYMITKATRIDTALRSELMNLHKAHVASLKSEERYSKQNIEFWSSLKLSTKSQLLQYFFKDSKKIDKIMGRKGYSAEIVDKTIQAEIATPFFIEQNKNSIIPMTGLYLDGPAMDSLANTREAEWNALEKIIRQQFNGTIAKRSLLTARIEWYTRQKNMPAYVKYSLVQLEKYPPDIKKWPGIINAAAWKAFLHITDKAILNEYIKWMKKVVESWPNNGGFIDTYANLLYKMGRKEDAIYWEERAFQVGPSKEVFRMTLEQMKKGEPTNGVQPLVAYK